MTKEQFLKNLEVPCGRIDAVLDTDAYNEIDDQYAISYLIRSSDKINLRELYAAPFSNAKCSGPKDGMEKSYNEILKICRLCGEEKNVYRGSEDYLKDENTPVISDAAKRLVEISKEYSPEKPLYVVAIGAITNVASAIIMDRSIVENTVVVWLGGHARHNRDNREFNLFQDVAAGRVVMESGVPFIQLPCDGVVSEFRISRPELEYWLVGKNPLADYLAKNAIAEAESYAAGKPWTRVIWDVTAAAWLLNDGERFMRCEKAKIVLPGYDDMYEKEAIDTEMIYVTKIHRDALMEDLIRKLTV